MTDLFARRVAVLATMHRKEQAIAPRLEMPLGLTVTVPAGFDTDGFGTFTGEVTRPADQLATARLKAEAALDYTGETLAIASEGSFGPHPQIPFVPCNRELVVLIDRQHGLEIVGECLSTETNYRQQPLRSWQDAEAFAAAVDFPSHGLIVRADGTVLAKGITTESALSTAVEAALRQAATVQIETDMRALYNPTRMGVIAQATEDLLRAIAQTCPNCACPGFREVKRWPGLPCGLCGTPTLLTRLVRHQCQRCDYQQDQAPADLPTAADPLHCPYCNP
ncbi:hypothetical protein GFS31_06330 [Leptolyngbya sp. BL0902]|uniref:DUF6671 family protein n=1 Tax=Leptolyngbya sp. BL0902 TaxID=1115757 RepID=UPI0018E8495C|nr:DUF6671 family protein [Leptolyngbya sp. BL0902]QQE63961.1 hypothetical protein GFS31_06330 [Leptolyngbya sp. BL0902]